MRKIITKGHSLEILVVWERIFAETQRIGSCHLNWILMHLNSLMRCLKVLIAVMDLIFNKYTQTETAMSITPVKGGIAPPVKIDGIVCREQLPP